MTMEETLIRAVLAAIETVGLDTFKRTSLFASNHRPVAR